VLRHRLEHEGVWNGVERVGDTLPTSGTSRRPCASCDHITLSTARNWRCWAGYLGTGAPSCASSSRTARRA
jgi:hypothetical protein